MKCGTITEVEKTAEELVLVEGTQDLCLRYVKFEMIIKLLKAQLSRQFLYQA